MGLLIAIEGIDGSGKGTQARRLTERLQKSGVRCQLISFPRYDSTFFGRAVGQFLNGKFGTLEEVHPFLVSLLFAGDRLESRPLLIEALATNDVVVLDRYVASNIAHQAAKSEGEERKALVRLIEELEFSVFQLPRPDLVLLLDLSAANAQKLIARKSARTYTDKSADLQEADAEYLARVRDLYLDLAHDNPGWSVVHCDRDGKILSIDEVAEEIWELVAARRTKRP